MQTQKPTEANRIELFKCAECNKTGCTYAQRVECNKTGSGRFSQ